MKRLLLIVVVTALALTLVPLALAGGQGKAKKKGHYKFNLVGVVQAPDEETPAVDADGWTITIKVRGGSHIKGLKRTVTTFNVAPDAKVRQIGKGRAPGRGLADIAAPDRVKVKGTYDVSTQTYTITAIKYIDRSPEPAVEEPAAPEPTVESAAQ